MTTLAPRLAVVLVALLTAACGLTGTGDPGTAAMVGDDVITAEEVDTTLASIRTSEAFQQQAQGDTSGQFVLDAQTQVLTSFVRSRILAEIAGEQGIEVTDEQVAAQRDELIANLGGPEAFEERLAQQGLDEAFVLQQLRDQQIQEALQAEIGQTDLAEFIRTETADVPIEVNPRYGRWDATGLAVAPFDPLADVDSGIAAGDATEEADEAP